MLQLRMEVRLRLLDEDRDVEGFVWKELVLDAVALGLGLSKALGRVSDFTVGAGIGWWGRRLRSRGTLVGRRFGYRGCRSGYANCVQCMSLYVRNGSECHGDLKQVDISESGHLERHRVLPPFDDREHQLEDPR